MQKISKIDPISVANGPGVRVAVFVSGCRMHCPGCFNKEAQSFEHGEVFDDSTIEHIIELLQPTHMSGITFLGGEPLEPENQPMLIRLARRVRQEFKDTKTIWCYTGFRLEDILDNRSRASTDTVKELLSLIDVLVDGPFMEEQHDVALRFRGSRNQRLIDIPATLSAGEIIPWSDGAQRGVL